MGEAVEARLVEPVCEDLCAAEAAALVEVELEIAAVPRSVGVEEGFRVAERVEEGGEGLDLVCEPCLALRVGRDPEDLVDEEILAEGFARSSDPAGKKSWKLSTSGQGGMTSMLSSPTMLHRRKTHRKTTAWG